jgi:hypothetical protein
VTDIHLAQESHSTSQRLIAGGQKVICSRAALRALAGELFPTFPVSKGAGRTD